MIIDASVLDKLSKQANESPRLRMNLDMRNSNNDKSQRNFNALEPGTIVPIHRHTKSSETCVIIRGALRSVFFNDDGSIASSVTLSPKEGIYSISIPPGQWHTVEVLEPGTVIFEAKDGAYEPLTEDDILNV